MSDTSSASAGTTQHGIAATAPTPSPRRSRGGLRGPEGTMGWLFVTPLIVILGLFLVIPIVMALWVSLTNWNGSANPFGGGQGAEFVGAKNYTDLFAKDGLTRSNFMQSIGNTFWYVLLVVPHPDGPRARARAARQRQVPQGPQLLPDRVLLPLGHLLDRDRHRLPLPLQRRGRQRLPREDRHHRPELVQ